jgi:hypothetical protein
MVGMFDVGADPKNSANFTVDDMLAAAAACPAVGPLPKLFCTSSFREPYNKWHGWRMATDWGNNSDQHFGSQEQDDMARWLATFFGPWSLEIIHVYSGYLPPEQATTEEWKNGVKQDKGWYGWETLEQHRGHVHWAITKEGLAAANAWWKTIARVTRKDDELIFPGVIDTSKELGMKSRGVMTLQGLLVANGNKLIRIDNTDKTVLRAAIMRAQEINGFPMTGVADEQLWRWLLRSAAEA